MGFTQLFKGMIGQFTDRFTNWTNEMNQNLRRLNMRAGGIKCLEQLATVADLPLTPVNGDTYVIVATKQIKTWYAVPGTWETDNLYVPDIFYDVDTDEFWWFDGTNILPFFSTPLPPENVVFSDSCGAFSTVSDTPVAVTNLEVEITSGGNSIEVYLTGDGTDPGGYAGIRNMTPTGTETRGFIEFLRDGVVICSQPMYLFGGGTPGESLWLRIPAGGFHFCDEGLPDGLPSGTYEYSVQAYIDSAVDADQTIELANCRLVARENK